MRYEEKSAGSEDSCCGFQARLRHSEAERSWGGGHITSHGLIFPAYKMRGLSYMMSNGLTNKKVLTLEFYYISSLIRKLSLISGQLSGLSREGGSPRLSPTCYHGASI